MTKSLASLFSVKNRLMTIMIFSSSYFMVIDNVAATGSSVTVNFSAVYTAATCSINVPSHINFNQGSYASGIPSSAIAGDNISKSFQIVFSDCDNNSLPSLKPQITVLGTTAEYAGVSLFSDTTGASDEAVGYGLKLSTTGNQFFNGQENLAENSVITSVANTTFMGLEGSNLEMKAVLSCGSEDCHDATTRKGGLFKATVKFRLSYE